MWVCMDSPFAETVQFCGVLSARSCFGIEGVGGNTK